MHSTQSRFVTGLQACMGALFRPGMLQAMAVKGLKTEGGITHKEQLS